MLKAYYELTKRLHWFAPEGDMIVDVHLLSNEMDFSSG